MKIKRWFSDRAARVSKRLLQRFSSQTRATSFAQAWLRGQEDSATTPPTLTSAFQQSTWVYACITTLAENISAIPFRIIGDKSGADAAAKLFEQPHRHMDRFAFWELIVTWLCLRGEAFIHPHLEGRVTRVPNSLLILNPDQMREIIADHELIGWNFTGSGANSPIPSTVLLPEEVIHIRLPNPFHLWRGMSPLTVAWLAAQTDYAAAQFMKGAMLNNADTGLIVSLPQQPEPDQWEQMRAALRERKRAAGTADRPLVLFNGAKIEKPAVSAMDLEFLENRKFNRQEICSIYKVPQELLGYTEDANRSVSDAARLNFVENRIAPLCKRLEAGIDPIVKKFGRELRGEFHVKATPVMQAAQRARIDSGLKLFGVGVPLNAVNAVLDLGLPELPHGDRTFLGSRYQELKSVAADVRRRTSKRDLFEQRCRTLATLENGRPQIEAIIADAIQRGEPTELILRRVRHYFNQLTTDNGQLTDL
ncbi:MAG TPA: phage portal protein [Verrucomicrobiae bacterium]|nr:phage portal protein [Verrucomicrobiae bacterium]